MWDAIRYIICVFNTTRIVVPKTIKDTIHEWAVEAEVSEQMLIGAIVLEVCVLLGLLALITTGMW